MTVDQINSENSKLVIVGWFIGLAYYNWFSSDALPLPWWIHAILIIGGMFISSIVIGGSMALLAATANKAAFGNPEARPNLFKLAGLIAAVLAFFVAKYALWLAATIKA
jgi:hypothetical protein